MPAAKKFRPKNRVNSKMYDYPMNEYLGLHVPRDQAQENEIVTNVSSVSALKINCSRKNEQKHKRKKRDYGVSKKCGIEKDYLSQRLDLQQQALHEFLPYPINASAIDEHSAEYTNALDEMSVTLRHAGSNERKPGQVYTFGADGLYLLPDKQNQNAINDTTNAATGFAEIYTEANDSYSFDRDEHHDISGDNSTIIKEEASFLCIDSSKSFFHNMEEEPYFSNSDQAFLPSGYDNIPIEEKEPIVLGPIEEQKYAEDNNAGLYKNNEHGEKKDKEVHDSSNDSLNDALGTYNELSCIEKEKSEDDESEFVVTDSEDDTAMKDRDFYEEHVKLSRSSVSGHGKFVPSRMAEEGRGYRRRSIPKFKQLDWKPVSVCRKLGKEDQAATLMQHAALSLEGANCSGADKRTILIDQGPVTISVMQLKILKLLMSVPLPDHLKEGLTFPQQSEESMARLRRYGLPFDSLMGREQEYYLPPKESYTLNGHEYLGAEATNNLYDPVFLKRFPDDRDNYGWCDICGQWFQMRNHSYAHHFKSKHGVSQRSKTTVALPNLVAGPVEKPQGYCQKCCKWVNLHHRVDNAWQSWFIHQFNYHHKDEKTSSLVRASSDWNVNGIFDGHLAGPGV